MSDNLCPKCGGRVYPNPLKPGSGQVLHSETGSLWCRDGGNAGMFDESDVPEDDDDT